MENLAKPHLAVLWGVEVGESFTIVHEGREFTDLTLSQEGYVFGDVPIYVIFDAINDPARVHRQVRLTEPELAICNVHHAAYVTAGKYNKGPWIHLWNGKPREIDGDFFGDVEGETEIIAWVNKKEFPSVHPGDLIPVDPEKQ